MSGESNCIVVDKIVQLDKVLDEFYEHIGMKFTSNAEIEKYLEFSRTDIETLKPNDCDIIIAEIAIYNIYLHQIHNKYQARVLLIQSEAKKEMSFICDNYKQWNWQEKQIAMLKDNQYLMRLHNVELDLTTKIKAMENMSNGLRNLSDSIKNIRYSKMAAAKESPYL